MDEEDKIDKNEFKLLAVPSDRMIVIKGEDAKNLLNNWKNPKEMKEFFERCKEMARHFKRAERRTTNE